MRTKRFSPRNAVLLVSMIVIAGCVEHQTKGSESTYRMEAWAIAAVGIGGIAMGVAGWFVRTKIARLGWVMLILGPVCTIFVAPMMYFDVVKVDDQHFERKAGFGGTSESHRFDDIGSMHYYSQTTGFGRRRRTNYYLDLGMKSGQTQRVSMGTLMQAARDEIMSRAQAKGIAVTTAAEE